MNHELVKTLQKFIVDKALHELVALLKVMEHLKGVLVGEAVRQSIGHTTLKWQRRASSSQQTCRQKTSKKERAEKKGEVNRSSHTQLAYITHQLQNLTHFGLPVVMFKDIGNIKAVEELKWLGEFE